MTRMIEFLKWPVVIGLLCGLIVLQIFPELNPRFADRSPTPTNSGKPITSYAEAVNRAAPAVVSIYTRKRVQSARQRMFNYPLFRYFYNNADIPRQQRMQSALGSGVIVTPDGYLLTNNHVIYGAEEIVVQMFDGREARARIVGVDDDNDLAVLKIELEHLHVIPFGNPQTARVGDIVLTIGNPFGMGQTVTQGIISATGRHGLGINPFENFIQTDAVINPGNSGGALVDVHGNLLGINTAIVDRFGDTDLDGVGLAVPADTAMRTVNDIVEFGKVVRGWLGVEAVSLTPQLANIFRLDTTNGVVITRIDDSGPARLAGLQPGDVIVKINGEPVGNGLRGRQQVMESRPGDVVGIDYVRDGAIFTTEATLEKKPLTE